MVRIVAFNTIGAALYALLVGSLIGWSAVITFFLTSLIYANVIGTAAHLVLPLVGTRLAARGPAVLWSGIAATLFGLGVAGSLVAGTIAWAVGLFPAGAFWTAQRTGLGIA